MKVRLEYFVSFKNHWFEKIFKFQKSQNFCFFRKASTWLSWFLFSSRLIFCFRCFEFRLKMPTAVEEETPETVDDVISGLSPGASTSSGSSWTTTSQRSVGQKMVSSRSSRPTPTAYQRLSILVDFDSRASHSLPLSLSHCLSSGPSLPLSFSPSPSLPLTRDHDHIVPPFLSQLFLTLLSQQHSFSCSLSLCLWQ